MLNQQNNDVAGGDIMAPVPVSNTNAYLIAVLGTAGMVLLAVTLIVILRPDKDNSSLIVSIIGFGATIVTALLSFIRSSSNSNSIQQLHLAVNSRLTALLEQTALASKAEGVKQEADKHIGFQDDDINGGERPIVG